MDNISAEELLTRSFDLVSSIIEARSSDELLSETSAVAKKCGFEHVLIGAQWLDARGELCYDILSGYPSEWQARYAEQGYMGVDPTVSYCQNNLRPLIWTVNHFKRAGCMEFFEEARDAGLSFGLSIPIHDATGAKAMVSLTRDQAFDEDPREAERLGKIGAILGNIAHFTYRRLIMPKIQGALSKKLTPNEITALRWVANGKTSWETGCIMHIAEPTVVFHLNNAMKKLNVVNRPQAIAAAFRLKLLE